jgi:hypothetical protein
MASIIKKLQLAVGAPKAWAMLRDVGMAHRAFPGVLRDCRQEGGFRLVTFTDGSVACERIVTIDEAGRRVAYAVVGGRFAHHSASMQIFAEDDGTCRFLWVSDFLPDELESVVRPLVEQGSDAFRRAAEAIE